MCGDVGRFSILLVGLMHVCIERGNIPGSFVFLCSFQIQSKFLLTYLLSIVFSEFLVLLLNRVVITVLTLVRPAAFFFVCGIMVQPVIETRSQANRLDQHEEQILKIQADLEGIRSEFARDREATGEFQKFMMSWVKRQEKSPDPDSEVVTQTPTLFNRPEGGGSSGGVMLQKSEPPGDMWAVKKVKLPDFSGFDPQGWLQKANLYFELNRTPPHLRIRLAQLSMVGVASHWFTIVNQIYNPLSWEQFQSELLQRFSGLDLHNPYEQLATMKQGDSIYDYIDDFEYMLSLVPKLPEPQSIGYFVAGLKEDVKRWVRLHRPQTRLDAMYLAKDIEGLLHSPRQQTSYSRFRYYSGSSDGPVVEHRSSSGSPRETQRPTFGSNGDRLISSRPDANRGYPFSRSVTATPKESMDFAQMFNRNRGIRSLTRTEWDERRKKGLCFRCGQQYGPTHKCPEGKLRILLLGEDEEEPDPGSLVSMESVLDESSHAPEEVPIGQCLALESTGIREDSISGGKTLKVEGLIYDIPIMALVDCGATHNFVSSKLMRSLGMAVEVFSGINIRLGDDHVVFLNQRCVGLPFTVAGCQFPLNALVFNMRHLDLILGMEWLESLGEVTHNWEKATMKFAHQGKMVFLQGLTKAGSSHAALQSWLSLPTSPKWRGTLLSTNRVNQGSGLLASYQQQLLLLCEEFEAVFREPNGLPPSRPHDHKIQLTEPHLPICVRPYRYPHIQKEEIEKQVQELLTLGMIRPSKSSFSSPVILVRKKDNSWRMCADYRALNKATVPDMFPIPVVDELIDELKGARFFSKLDLKSGYNQIRMDPDSIEKTAFRTHDGHYEYLVMPFGLTNAPATFQAIMNDIFRPLLRKSVVVFFDDILIYSPSWESHLQDLKVVLNILWENQFMVNKKKCSFGQQRIEYLGHIIDGEGVTMDPKKIEAVLDWPIPRNIKGLRGFLGLTGYYRKFIRHYGSIARPLTDLTKKDAFKWHDEAQKSFESLKEALVTAPLLALPDFTLPFVVECDASGRGIGAVLMQQNRPLAYFSKGLSDRNLAKSAYEREIMALVLAVQHWRSYLLGTKFTVFTDQKSLKFLLQQRITTPDQQNWVAKLLGYNFDINYKPGSENRAADALSRRDIDGELSLAISTPIWVQGAQLLDEIKNNTELQNQKAEVESDPAKHPGFYVRSGVLYYKDRLVIPKDSKFIPSLLLEFHQSAAGGHSGYYRTYRRLATNVYWPGMIARVQEFVKACDICQRCKASSAAPGGLLQPLSIPSAIWEDVSMDFIVGLPKSKGFDAILVVVDRLSKYAHFILLKHPYTAKIVAEAFTREVIRHHGIPQSIVSDRDPIFLSSFWREIFRSQGTKLNMSSAYHPETDGQTEVINRCLEAYLRCFAVDQPRTWSTWIPWAEFWYNSTFHSSTGKSPFEVVYGRKPPTILQFVPGEVRVQSVLMELQDRNEALKQLKQHLSQSQARMKENADKKRRDVQFQVGEWVYVKLKPYRQMSVVRRVHQKLAARFFGPFQILEKIGPVAYKLDLPPTSKIHPVFHSSLLKKTILAPAEPSLPPELEIEEADMAVPIAILATRNISKLDETTLQWLVQWKDAPVEEATWEDALTIQSQFPHTSLEDKTLTEGGGNDGNGERLMQQTNTPRQLMVYSRRAKKGITQSG
ncbi:hypothetical protein OROMI_010562 [Orobanche minor]